MNMIKMARVAVSLLFVITGSLQAATMSVPGDYSTIQEAINAALEGDRIEVEPGTYHENLDFSGKAITVTGYYGPEYTTIDGGQAGSVVSFASGEGLDSILQGFSIINGTGTLGQWGVAFGGGLFCLGASPTLRDLRISANIANMGGGIYLRESSPWIESCEVMRNDTYKGAGIYCYLNSSPTILNTFVYENVAQYSGGGICCWKSSSPNIYSSTIVRNRSSAGGGLYITIDSAPIVANCILYLNTAYEGPQIYLGSRNFPSHLDINYCDAQGGPSKVFLEIGCTYNWGSGMINTQPRFKNLGDSDYHLAKDSPCIDVGDNSAQIVPQLDVDEQPRTWNGITDMGADERYEGELLYVPATYSTIQAAIDASYPDDTVRVSPGTYNENFRFNGRAVLVKAGYGPNYTTIDGGQAGSVVTFADGEGPDSVLQGFTITNGSSLTGGGIYCEHSHGTITKNNIAGNLATDGAGIYCTNAAVHIVDNDISGNLATHGGGIFCADNDTSLIEQNTITANGPTDFGGGIWCGRGATSIITFNTITGNQNSGLWIVDASPEIRSNTIGSNSCFDNGGGIHLEGASIDITSNLIFGNSGFAGGGIYCLDASPTLTSNTIVKNRGFISGGGLHLENASPTITNSILWDNISGTGSQIHIVSGSPTVTYCDVLGGWTGTGNIDADPEFFETQVLDYHLTYTSPCLNAGDVNAPGLPDEDFEGDPRSVDLSTEIGADEVHRHLYYTGDVIPGTDIDIRVTGKPNSQVKLVQGSGVLAEPSASSYGDLYLEAPYTIYELNPIPSSGVLIFAFEVPPEWVPEEIYPFQALVGPLLTNLMVLEVDLTN